MKIFIASTCYDLRDLRSSLKESLIKMGFEPILSDFYDVLYDPSDHTHKSCIDAVPKSDILLLVIGKHYGGEVVNSVMDFINIINDSKNDKFLENFKDGHISITQAEVITAIKHNIPIFVFIEKSVMTLHHLYEKNKGNEHFKEIEFPDFKKDTASYIFEFINYLRGRPKGNAYIEFTDSNDLFLKFQKQIILKFQDLLLGDRERKEETENYIFSKIVEHNSLERQNSFTELFSNIDGGDEIRILGTGVTKFLTDTELVESYLESGNKIKILLINDQIIKDDWACSSKEFISKFNNKNNGNKAEILSELEAKTICPLSDLNILIDKNHFLHYYFRKEYLKEMSNAYELIKSYKKQIDSNRWLGSLEVKHFFSLVPMSITAVLPDHSPNRKLLVEFIIPFTKNRIILKSSLSENRHIYTTFMSFFEETWKRAKDISLITNKLIKDGS